MRKPRLFITVIDSLTLDAPQDALVRDADFHHLRNVLRLTPGDLFEGIDAKSGASFECVVSTIEHDAARITIQAPLRAPTRATRSVTLVYALTKPASCDLVVEKAVELGVARIIFFQAERSQGTLGATDIQRRHERFERVGQAAMKQSGAARIPEMKIYESLETAVATVSDNARSAQLPSAPLVSRIICIEPSFAEDNREFKQPVRPLSSIFRNSESLDKYIDSPGSASPPQLEIRAEYAEIYIIVGPEGGITRHEFEIATRAGYTPVGLGEHTLRSETAAIVACGIALLVS